MLFTFNTYFVRRDLLTEFGTKMLGFTVEELSTTPAWHQHQQLSKEEADLLLKSKVLAYSYASWSQYSLAAKEFQCFCRLRGVNPLECPPTLISTFLLMLGQSGKSYGSINATLAALTFLYKFFLVNFSLSLDTIPNILKFLQKACTTVKNVKNPLGSKEIRLIWDALDKKYKNIADIPLLELRSFVMTVFQHSTFCRFSDLAPLKLEDLSYDLDYFTVTIKSSKTDQSGQGQMAYLSVSTTGFRSPHNLMCLYIHRVHTEQDENAYLFPPLK